MTALVERLLPLWTQPIGARADAEAAFAEVYADPVVVNGVAMTIAELAGRARSLQQAFDRLDMDILDIVETPGRIVITFIMRGRHAGPYPSPLGTVAPTHRDIQVRTIDVLTIVNGLISAIWVVSDDLALLRQLDAVTLTPSRHPGPLRLMPPCRRLVWDSAVQPMGGSDVPGTRGASWQCARQEPAHSRQRDHRGGAARRGLERLAYLQ